MNTDKKDNNSEQLDELSRAGEETQVETGLDDLEQALAEAVADLDKHKDALLRQQAEAQNSRNRAAREMEKARKFALEGFMKELLPVYDTFERSLEAENASAEDLRQGSELTMKMLAKALEKFGLKSICPQVEEVFNPEFHEAVTMVPVAGQESGAVIEVIQKGYTLNDRLIRPAMVIVAQ